MAINAGPLKFAPKTNSGGGGGCGGWPMGSSNRKRKRGKQQTGSAGNTPRVKDEAGYSGGGSAQPPAENLRGGRGGRGGRGRGGRGGRGGGRGGPAKVAPESACYGYSKGFGNCQGCAAGSKCANGRTHKCHLCGGAHAAKDKACDQGKALYQ